MGGYQGASAWRSTTATKLGTSVGCYADRAMVVWAALGTTLNYLPRASRISQSLVVILTGGSFRGRSVYYLFQKFVVVNFKKSLLVGISMHDSDDEDEER